MQNWNQWQLPAATAVAAPMPQPPIGYAATGTDPMATMQAYMQYYNQPAPSGYTAEQWATAQQQNWAQWQTWQQQYQQWQAQYGEKYQETMKQMSTQNLSSLPQISTSVVQPPPLPKDDYASNKPPLPPESNAFAFPGIPPPHQNNLPLFPSTKSTNPPLPPGQPPLPSENLRNSNVDNPSVKRVASSSAESGSVKKTKVGDDELTIAEKKFDAQFKEWEEQYNNWKQQNVNHPDKTRYKEYEAQWTSWREKLIERREQMRRKREQQKQATAKAEAEKDKSLVGDDKILNLLSSTENQGLINNLLGIGKTLGLTGKSDVQQGQQQIPNVPPPSLTVPSTTMATPAMTPNMNQAAWAAQQWAAQYNAGMNMSNYQNSYQQTSVMPQVPPNTLANPMSMPNFNQPPGNFNHPPGNFSQPPGNFPQPPGNFNQPPPNMLGPRPNFQNAPPNVSPNFSQPPPGFGSSNSQQRTDSSLGQRSDLGNSQERNTRPFRSEGESGQSLNRGRDSIGSANDRFNFDGNRFTAPPPNNQFGTNAPYGGRDGSNKDFTSGNQLAGGSDNNRQNNSGRDFSPGGRSTNDFRSNDRFASGFDRDQANNRSNRDDDNQQDNRFNSGNNNRFNANNDQFKSDNDRFGSSNDRFRSSNDHMGSFSGDRFGSSMNRTGMNNLASANDKFSHPPPDRFASRDNSRDSGSSNSRGFGRINQFDPPADMPPELQKLMEKRKAAMDVFKPSNFSSLLDSAKNNSGPSLSESFRKITGDSPFLSRSSTDFGKKDTNLGSKGSMLGTSSTAMGTFDSSHDHRPGEVPGFKFRELGDFRSPGGGGEFANRHNDTRDFGSRGSDGRENSPRRLGDFGSSRMNNEFGSRSVADAEVSPRNDKNKQQGSSDNQSSAPEKSDRMQSPRREESPIDQLKKFEEGEASFKNVTSSDGGKSKDESMSHNVPPLQIPPWIGSDLSNDDIIGPSLDNSKEEPNDGSTNPSQNKSQPPAKPEGSSINVEQGKDESMETDKKSDALPFMGENDPKPEDLNMEPPPELPNLGPIVKDTQQDSDSKGTTNEKFGRSSGESDRQINFDCRQPHFGPRETDDECLDKARPSSGPFGSHGTNDGSSFGLRGPPQSFGGPRGPPFGPRPIDFGPRGPTNFGPRGPCDFGPRGPGDFGPRGPPGFGPRGPADFGPRGPCSFGPRGPGDFGPPGPPNFAPRGSQFSSNTFPPPRGNLDNSGTGIPSLMSFKFDRPINPPDDIPPIKNDNFESNRCEDLPPAFRKADQDQRPFGSDDFREDRNNTDHGVNTPRGSNWRESFGRNKFGDSDQRTGPPSFNDNSIRSDNQNNPDRDRSLFGSNDQKIDDRIHTFDRPCFDESTGSNNKDHSSGTNFITRRSNDRRSNDKDFCVEKQFNYNHSAGIPDEISKEHAPLNVIDYDHASRIIVHDYVTPAQCYDYAHGKLKPIVSDHEIYSKKDFRHWVENEQNLREYTDRMRIYESDMRALKRGYNHHRQPEVVSQFREHSKIIQDDRRSYDRDRRSNFNRNDRSRRERDSDDFRERDRRRESRERGRIERDREWERNSNKKDRDDRSQHRRSRSKDRTRERTEKRKETSKENKKDEERSKGNVAGSESTAKKPEESTKPDNSKHESNDGEPEESLKIIEETNIDLPKLPVTMELPKTPNFTMVDDLLGQPGRQNRPPKIVVILRGPPGSGKSFVAKLIKDKEVEQGGSAPRILSLDDYFLTEKEIETEDNNGKKVTTKEMVYEYEEAMEPSYITSLIKAFKKNIVDGFFNFIILDSINEKISDYEEMWSFAKTKGFRVYVCEMEMDVQICLKRNIHNRTEEEINRIVDYFEPTPGYHQKLDVTSMLQEEAIEEVHMEDSQEVEEEPTTGNDDSQDSQEELQDSVGVSKWEKMEAEDKLDRLDGLAKKKHESKPQTMEDFLQVPDYYNMEDNSGKKRVRWADLEERKEQEKMRAVGFVVGQTNWDRMMDPTKGGSALTRTKYI